MLLIIAGYGMDVNTQLEVVDIYNLLSLETELMSALSHIDMAQYEQVTKVSFCWIIYRSCSLVDSNTLTIPGKAILVIYHDKWCWTILK